MGAENPVTLCDLSVFADQAAEPISPKRPVGCRYSVTAVNCDILRQPTFSRCTSRPLLLRGLGHHRRRHEDYRGYMNGRYEDHARPWPDAAEVTDRAHRSNNSRAAVPGQL